MDKFYIYVSYDNTEYKNYFHLVMNHQKLIEYCIEEEIDVLFDFIEKESLKKSFELHIIQDKEAYEWDYSKKFKEHKMEICSIDNVNIALLYQEFNQSFKNINAKNSEIVFSGNYIFEREDCKINANFKKVDEKLTNEDDEITELARIIKEKYKRIK